MCFSLWKHVDSNAFKSVLIQWTIYKQVLTFLFYASCSLIVSSFNFTIAILLFMLRCRYICLCKPVSWEGKRQLIPQHASGQWKHWQHARAKAIMLVNNQNGFFNGFHGWNGSRCHIWNLWRTENGPSRSWTHRHSSKNNATKWRNFWNIYEHRHGNERMFVESVHSMCSNIWMKISHVFMGQLIMVIQTCYFLDCCVCFRWNCIQVISWV